MTEPKVALVTGSGKKRVGWHVARALARRGYAVGIHFRASEDEAHSLCADLREQGAVAIPFQADLTDENAVQEMISQFMATFQRIDVLVNSAGIWERKKLEDIRAADVRAHLEVNTLGTFLCCQRAGLVMVHQPTGGSIVNIGDWATARPYRDFAAYFPSKGAIGALTRSMAIELGTRNPRVRVNAVLPGPVMLPPSLQAEERQQAIAATLVQREGSPDNIAQAVLFFVDNDFVTGTCLPVDGGRSIYAGETV